MKKSIVFLALMSLIVNSCIQDNRAACLIPDEVDLGIVVYGDSIQKTIPIINTGKEVLVISGVKTTCNCFATSYDMAIPPNDTGNITVRFKGSYHGKINQLVMIETNSIPVLKKVLLSGYVKN